MRARTILATVLLVLAAGAWVGCGRSGPAVSAGSGRAFVVVAAEDTWGSIAAQLAGDRASVRSIIVNPEADPHSYQPSAADARLLAGASMVIVNGLGYDPWAEQLMQASPAAGRVVVNVGRDLGLAAGANPHRWYFPGDVEAMVRRIAAEYGRLDPRDASYFALRAQAFLGSGLARYDRLRRQIRERYAGVPVGYSESIFEGLGEDLHLKLLTPYGFAKAISEGTDVTAADKLTVDRQARTRQIRVWVYNSQNVTPDVQRVTEIARQAGIPVATVTETLTPEGASFQQWQVAQLEGLARALHAATGR